MKRPLPMAAIVISAFAAGCTPTEEKLTLAANAEIARQTEKIQAATARAALDLQNQAYTQRTEFVATMHTQLADLNRSLDALSARLTKASSATQAEAAPQLVALRVIATRLRMRLGEVVNATPASWGPIKADCERAHTALKDGVAQWRQSFCEGTTP